MKTRLIEICHGRSGDKGDAVNIGIIARHPEIYAFIERTLTVQVMQEYFGDMVKGDIERYELPNLGALNFLMHGALGGGGTKSLMNDAQGKTFAAAALRMELEVPDELIDRVRKGV